MSKLILPHYYTAHQAPLLWSLFRYRGQSDTSVGTNFLQLQITAVMSPETDLNQTHQGVGLLAASLTGWSWHASRHEREHPQSWPRFPLPGEPDLEVHPGDCFCPLALAPAMMIARGVNPFVHLDQPDACPLFQAVCSGASTVLVQMLRHPDVPSAERLDAIAPGGLVGLALAHNHAHLVPSLLAHGCSADLPDATHQPPLAYAKLASTVSQLLNAGASPLWTDTAAQSLPTQWTRAAHPERQAMIGLWMESVNDLPDSENLTNWKTYQREQIVFEDVLAGRVGTLPRSGKPMPTPRLAADGSAVSLLGQALLGCISPAAEVGGHSAMAVYRLANECGFGEREKVWLKLADVLKMFQPQGYDKNGVQEVWDKHLRKHVLPRISSALWDSHVPTAMDQLTQNIQSIDHELPRWCDWWSHLTAVAPEGAWSAAFVASSIRMWETLKGTPAMGPNVLPQVILNLSRSQPEAWSAVTDLKTTLTLLAIVVASDQVNPLSRASGLTRPLEDRLSHHPWREWEALPAELVRRIVSPGVSDQIARHPLSVRVQAAHRNAQLAVQPAPAVHRARPRG